LCPRALERAALARAAPRDGRREVNQVMLSGKKSAALTAVKVA
jgi:ribosomal protein S7